MQLSTDQLHTNPNLKFEEKLLTMIPLSSLKDHIPTTSSSLFSTYASFAGSIMLVRTVANEFLPYQLRTYIYSTLRRLFSPLSSRDLTLIIEQTSGGTPDQLFEAASLYLGTKISSSNTDRLRLGKTPRQKNISFSIDKGQEIFDTFDNVKLKWRYLCTEPQSENKYKFEEKRYFQLKFPKKHKDKVVDSYLPHVFAQANAIKEEQKVIKIYSRSSGLKYGHVTHSNPDGWGGSMNLEHPATFDTMAMDPELKKMIVEDLERFVRRREFYKKVGKAWKRGYLLYGPAGTGKSSLIAAMANYLKFDVYDLELSSVSSDMLLKRILLSTTNRSILVIEDIDCSIDIEDREYEEQTQKPYPRTKFTLSGLLNFIDGLWSSCGDERIIVFTTNHKDRLDPALLRPGRMDVHIHMSYLTPSGFKVLASNYLDIRDNNPHRLCEKIEGLIKSTEVTPAEVAEELMKSDDADVALGGLVNFLKRKRVENEEREKEEESNGTYEVQEAKRKKTDDNYNKIVTNGRLARRSIFKSTVRRPMDLPMLF